MRALPDLSSPKSIRNLAIATLAPAAAGFAFARYFQGRMTEEEAVEFEKQVDEFTKAENPVVSLDPSLNDTREEKSIDKIGLKKTAGVLGNIKALPTGTKAVLGTAVGVPAGLGAYAGAKKLFGKESNFTGTMEPGLLVAAAYIAALAGLASGRKAHSKDELKRLDSERSAAMNALEKSEYDRLFQLNDPEGYAAYMRAAEDKRKQEADAVVDETVPKVSYSEADMLNSMVLIQKQAGSKGATNVFDWAWKGLGSGGRIAAGAGAGTLGASLAYKAWGPASGTVGFIKQAYPVIFAMLLLGGAAAGKHMADAADTSRTRKKALKNYLTKDLLDTQSPAILEVGSELPWEKAKSGGADLAMSTDDLPEEARSREIRERREIRI